MGSAEESTVLCEWMVPVGIKFERNGHRLEVVQRLSSGSFSEVYKVRCLSTYKNYAMKIENQEQQRAALILDTTILAQLQGKFGFPQILLSGRTNKFNFLIMQLVGQNIAKLRHASPNKRFSTATTLRIASQTLDRIHALHLAGYLNRDIKASNFTIGLDKEEAVIYMIDFGLARRYRNNDTGEILPKRATCALLGTMGYTSLASHEQQDQCRRDDLESWFYMCVEMFSGGLPWSEYSELPKHRIVGDMKRFYRGPGRYDLLKNCPIEFDNILNIIEKLGFYQVPDYRKIHSEISAAVKRLGLDENEPFDWQKDPRLVERSYLIDEDDP